MRRSSDAHVNNVAWMELSAAPQLGLTIDGHLTARDQDLGARKLVAAESASRGSAGGLVRGCSFLAPSGAAP